MKKGCHELEDGDFLLQLMGEARGTEKVVSWDVEERLNILGLRESPIIGKPYEISINFKEVFHTLLELTPYI